MIDDPEMEEIYRMKDAFSARFRSVREMANAIGRFNAENPLPSTPKSRKLIEGFPKGQSVGNVKETTGERCDSKEKRSENLRPESVQPKPPKERRAATKPPLRSYKGLKTREGK